MDHSRLSKSKVMSTLDISTTQIVSFLKSIRDVINQGLLMEQAYLPNHALGLLL